jgi:hypothetical protein
MRLLSSSIAAIAAAATLSVALADVPFQPLADFGFGGSPYDISASGRIVGELRSQINGKPGPYVPVIWDSVTSAPVELPTEAGGYALAINSIGDIVGCEFQAVGSTRSPVLWVNGQEKVTLPDLGEGGYASDINDAGVIVGTVISKGQYKAARWINRQLEILALPEFDSDGQGIWSFANSINSSGLIAGSVQAPSGTPSAALRWDSKGAVSLVPSDGIETKGVSIDNGGGVLINGYFDGGASRAPALVMPDGQVSVFSVPPQYLAGAVALAMSRNSIVAGYFYNFDLANSQFQIKGVAWPNGVFTELELPAGQSFAFPGGVGSNGVVFGSVYGASGDTTVPGLWALDIGNSLIQPLTAAGSPGDTVELSAVSMRGNVANVGHSVLAMVDDAIVGQAITDESGRARVSFTIPAGFQGSQISVRYTDENGAVAFGTIEVTPECNPADLNCDGTVNSPDVATLLSQWGGSGSADLNRDGVVNSLDLSALLAAWGT